MLSQPGGARRAVPSVWGWLEQANLALSDGEMKAGIVLTSMNAPWVGGEQEEL